MFTTVVCRSFSWQIIQCGGWGRQTPPSRPVRARAQRCRVGRRAGSRRGGTGRRGERDEGHGQELPRARDWHTSASPRAEELLGRQVAGIVALGLVDLCVRRKQPSEGSSTFRLAGVTSTPVVRTTITTRRKRNTRWSSKFVGLYDKMATEIELQTGTDYQPLTMPMNVIAALKLRACNAAMLWTRQSTNAFNPPTLALSTDVPALRDPW